MKKDINSIIFRNPDEKQYQIEYMCDILTCDNVHTYKLSAPNMIEATAKAHTDPYTSEIISIRRMAYDPPSK